MAALKEGHCIVDQDDGCIDLGFEQEPETKAIVDAVKVLLQGLGEDINRDGIIKTPLRVAKALREGTRGYRQNAKDIVQGALFPEAGLENGVGHGGGLGGSVIVRDTDLFSYCESCLLPFQVKCHVAYVPSANQVLGLSKFSRVVDVFAKRLQEPQRLADEVCSALQLNIKPTGVAVVLQCSHIDFDHNGWTEMLVSSGSGIFENAQADVWDEFLIRLSGIDVDKIRPREVTSNICWRSSTLSKTGTNTTTDSGMISVVASIIKSLGDDPSRKELQGTPARFVKWMMRFKNCTLDLKLNGLVLGRVDAIQSDGENIRSELNFPFWSQCEHHLLPFYGVVHIGYIGNEGINLIGKSMLQSIVQFYGFKLQVQERLTQQIAKAASSIVGEDIMVEVVASHTCMCSRGIEKFGCTTVTNARLGRFLTDATARLTFLRIVATIDQ